MVLVYALITYQETTTREDFSDDGGTKEWTEDMYAQAYGQNLYLVLAVLFHQFPAEERLATFYARTFPHRQLQLELGIRTFEGSEQLLDNVAMFRDQDVFGGNKLISKNDKYYGLIQPAMEKKVSKKLRMDDDTLRKKCPMLVVFNSDGKHATSDCCQVTADYRDSGRSFEKMFKLLLNMRHVFKDNDVFLDIIDTTKRYMKHVLRRFDAQGVPTFFPPTTHKQYEEFDHFVENLRKRNLQRRPRGRQLPMGGTQTTAGLMGDMRTLTKDQYDPIHQTHRTGNGLVYTPINVQVLERGALAPPKQKG